MKSDEALGRRVGQPLLDGDAVALGLRNLLAVLVEEEFVVEVSPAARRRAPGRSSSIARPDGDQVLAGHFVVDAERRPAHAQSAFHCSLQWPPVTGTSAVCSPSSSSKVIVPASVRRARSPALAARGRCAGEIGRNGRIGLLALLAQGRQHDLHDAVVAGQDLAAASASKRPDL